MVLHPIQVLCLVCCKKWPVDGATALFVTIVVTIEVYAIGYTIWHRCCFIWWIFFHESATKSTSPKNCRYLRITDREPNTYYNFGHFFTFSLACFVVTSVLVDSVTRLANYNNEYLSQNIIFVKLGRFKMLTYTE